MPLFNSILRWSPGRQSCLLWAAYLLGIAAFFRAPDVAFFGGDSWEYQSMAVNAVHGEGMKSGSALPLETYRFDDTPVSAEFMDHFLEQGRLAVPYSVYRTPGYPCFMTAVYSVCGIHPRAVYFAQMVLLATVAAFLPVLGHRIAGQTGKYVAVLAGAGFLVFQAPGIAREMMTESLIVATLFGVALVFQIFVERPSIPAACFLGLVAGMAALVKGSLIFIPVLIGALTLLQCLRKQTGFLQLPIMASAMAFPILGWSSYATLIHGKGVFLSTQGDKVLLDGNNELGLQDGGWHPEWHSQTQFWVHPDEEAEDLMYNQAAMQARSPWAQVFTFYQEHASRIPRFLMHKMNRAFERYLPFRVLTLLLVLDGFFSVFRVWSKPRIVQISALLLAAAFYFVLPKIYVVFAEISFWLGLAAIQQCLAWACPRWGGFRLPLVFLLFFGNYAIVTLLTFGFRRFVMPLDPFILFVLGCLIVSWVRRLQSGRAHPDAFSYQPGFAS